MLSNFNNIGERDLQLFDFGKYRGLFFDGRVDRNTVPEGIHVYDIRHTDNGSLGRGSVADFVRVNHGGTIFMNAPIVFAKGKDYYSLNNYNFADDCDTPKKAEDVLGWLQAHAEDIPSTSRKKTA